MFHLRLSLSGVCWEAGPGWRNRSVRTEQPRNNVTAHPRSIVRARGCVLSRSRTASQSDHNEENHLDYWYKLCVASPRHICCGSQHSGKDWTTIVIQGVGRFLKSNYIICCFICYWGFWGTQLDGSLLVSQACETPSGTFWKDRLVSEHGAIFGNFCCVSSFCKSASRVALHNENLDLGFSGCI